MRARAYITPQPAPSRRTARRKAQRRAIDEFMRDAAIAE
jgi:hypothetical protein